MKKVLTFLLLLLLGIAVFSACDKIDAPYTEGGGTNPPPPDTTTQTVKTVLVEDYTGHTCPNCPSAAVEAEHLKETYGNNKVIVIAVHAGHFAEPRPGTIFSLDLRSNIGNEWDDYFGISNIGNPKGLIDRVTFPQGMVLGVGIWSSKVLQELNKTPQVSIKITNSFNQVQNGLTTTVSGRFLASLDGDYFLQVCLTEDSIIGAQMNGSNYNENYVFMDVLRSGMNTNWGEHISEGGSVVKDQPFEKTYTQIFKSDWIPKHCHVVAFIYKNADKSILQTAEKNVITQ